MNWKTGMRIACVLSVVSAALAPASSAAQEANCREIAATARMARAPSMSALEVAKKIAGKSYRARLIFAYRSFQLRRTRAKAEELLSLIPGDENQQTIVMTLGDSLCDGESVKDMKTLSRVNEGVANEFTRAVILVPKFMSSYVAYSLVATQDPHSDFAVRMSKVCQQDHSAFVDALKRLPDNEQQSFSQHVMDADHCKALAVPEASWQHRPVPIPAGGDHEAEPLSRGQTAAFNTSRLRTRTG